MFIAKFNLLVSLYSRNFIALIDTPNLELKVIHETKALKKLKSLNLIGCFRFCWYYQKTLLFIFELSKNFNTKSGLKFTNMLAL